SRSLFSLIAVAVCWSVVRPAFGINYFGRNINESEAVGLKIMSWNVHLFDLGGWTEDETSKGQIIHLIQAEDPDILCLQEFYRDADNLSEPYIALIQK